MRPSAVTHETDTEQRSVALDIPAAAVTDGDCAGWSTWTSLDKREGIAPSGWYMLMLDDELGVPSKAAWIWVE